MSAPSPRLVSCRECGHEAWSPRPDGEYVCEGCEMYLRGYRDGERAARVDEAKVAELVARVEHQGEWLRSLEGAQAAHQEADRRRLALLRELGAALDGAGKRLVADTEDGRVREAVVLGEHTDWGDVARLLVRIDAELRGEP